MSTPVHKSPLAVASDGSLLVSVHHLHGDLDLDRLLEVARRIGGPVFIGVGATTAERSAVITLIDDAATEAASRILAGRLR